MMSMKKMANLMMMTSVISGMGFPYIDDRIYRHTDHRNKIIEDYKNIPKDIQENCKHKQEFVEMTFDKFINDEERATISCSPLVQFGNDKGRKKKINKFKKILENYIGQTDIENLTIDKFFTINKITID